MAVSKLNPVSGGVTQKVQEFTSTGTFVVPSNCTAVEVFLVGGGGGAGGASNTGATCAGGGGGGGQVIPGRFIPVTAGASYTVTIGAGGAGSSTNAIGSYGNDSSFGSLLVAQGGGGGGTLTNGGGRTNPSVKATSGSFCSNNTTKMIWASGAASTLMPTSNTVAPFPIPLNPSEKSGSYSVSFSSTVSDVDGTPGLGIQGFGGGGPTGNSTSGSWATVSFDNGAVASGTLDTAGNNAPANKGGGGSGGTKSGANATKAGGSGGSGYALITYWS